MQFLVQYRYNNQSYILSTSNPACAGMTARAISYMYAVNVEIWLGQNLVERIVQ